MKNNNDITLSNWYVGENPRHSFLHMAEFLPTLPIKRGKVISELSARPRDVLDIRFQSTREQCTVKEMLANTFTDGFMVLHQGKIVAEHYFDYMKPEHLHLSMSVSKSLTSAVMGVLHDHSEIDLAKPVDFYVPELKNCGYAGATVDQVLDMRSGVIFDEIYELDDPDALVNQFDRCMGWKPHRNDTEPKSIREFLLRLEKGREHGSHFQYRSTETEVLGWILLNITGKSLADNFTEILWQPMGAEMDANFAIDSNGWCVADGGLNACMRDYARFGQLICQKGFFNNRQIVPQQWVESCQQGDVDAFRVMYGFNPDYPLAAYKRQWWIYSDSVFCALGVGGQMIYIDHKNDVVVVKLSSWPTWGNDEYENDAILCAQAITRELVY